jgi:hypothetical protein
MMQTNPTSALKRALRPPRAGSADSDRLAMRAALIRILNEHADRRDSLRRAGYGSAEEFTAEVSALIASSSEQLTANVFAALFGDGDGVARHDGRLGRLLRVV